MMQIIITRGELAQPKFWQVSSFKLWSVLIAMLTCLLSLMIAVSYGLLLVGAAQNVPILSSASGRLVQVAQEQAGAQGAQAQINAIAQRVGQMQAQLTQLDALNQRLSTTVGIVVPEQNSKASPASADANGFLTGKGGVLVLSDPTIQQVEQLLASVQLQSERQEDWLLSIEAKMFEERIKKLLLPTQMPVEGVAIGSRFGRRTDPFTGAAAIHTGVDFAAPTGTPVLAAASGVVVSKVTQSGYGNLLEIDHGKGLVTRYAHLSRFDVNVGDLVKRGQKVAEVGNTGRSTGPHLHFEVLADGAFQDPQRFLEVGKTEATTARGYSR